MRFLFPQKIPETAAMTKCEYLVTTVYLKFFQVTWKYRIRLFL